VNAALPLGVVTLALSGCVAMAPGNTVYTAPEGYAVTAEGGALRVTRTAQAFGYADGAEARRGADAFCRGKVKSSPEDNFQAGAWVYPGGCA